MFLSLMWLRVFKFSSKSVPYGRTSCFPSWDLHLYIYIDWLIGRVRHSTGLIEIVESMILMNFEKTLGKNLREFLFGNSQTGSASRGLQISYMELGTPYKTRSYLFCQTKIHFWE